MDIGAVILLGGGVAGLVGFLAYHAFQIKRDHANMAGQAAERGWIFTRGTAPRIYTIEGKVNDAELAISCRRPIGWMGQNSGSGPSLTTVTLAAPDSEAVLALVPRLPEGLASGIGGEMINRLILHDRASILAGTREVNEGVDPAVLSEWVVHASNPAAALHSLDPQTVGLWQELRERLGHRCKLVFLRYADRAEVRVPETIKRFEDIDQLVRLAASLAKV